MLPTLYAFRHPHKLEITYIQRLIDFKINYPYKLNFSLIFLCLNATLVRNVQLFFTPG